MAISVGDLAINVSTNIASLEVGMRRANEIATQTANKISSAFSAAQATLAGLGVGLSLGALVAGLKSVIDYADKLNDLSKSTGIAVETLGGLGYAAKTAGVDLETVAKGTQNLARAMADAAGGNTQLTDLFQRMGVQIKDTTGALRPLDDVLFDVASKFQSYADGPEKAALATELFRKGGQALIPLLDEGGEKLRALVDEYQRYGGVASDTAARADAFNDSLEKIRLIQGSLLREMASALLPTLQAIANVFLDAKSKGEGFKGIAESMVVAVKSLAIAGVGVVTAFQAVGKSIGAVFAAFSLAITGDFKGALAALKIGFGDVAETVKTAMGRAADIWGASTATIAAKTETNLSKTRAPIKETGKAVEELVLSLQKLLKPFDDMAKALGKTGVELEAQLSSLRNYGVELKASSVITAEYELTEGKLADRFQVLSFLYPQVAEVVRAVILARAQLNDETQTAIELERRYLDAVRAHVDSLGDSVRTVENEITAERARSEAIGRTRVEVVELRIAQEEANAITLRSIEGADLEVRASELRIAALRKLRNETANTDNIQAQFDDLRGMFNTLDSIGRDIFHSIGDKGVDMWTKIRDAGKKILLDFLYQLTFKPFLITIAASLTGVSGNAAANALGGGAGGNPLSFLSSLFGNSGASLGGNLAASGYPTLGGFVNGVTNPLATLGTAFSQGAEAAGGFASILGASIPVVGAVIAGLSLFSGFLKKEPSEVRGRFQIGGSNFEDSVSTPSRFGPIGFADADTAQFSGEAAQLFNKIVAGALDAFEQRFSAEQSDRLAGILQKTDFGSFEGTFTTEDFIKQYGGQVLQQVVSAAFDVLDPALGSVARQFKGTADEVATFGNSLLAIYDATKGLGEDLRANIIGALSDATQATADKVAAFVGIFKAFGDGIAGLKPQLEALDPQGILAFVDALGGAQKAAEAFAFIGANFTTSADKLKAAQTALTTSFDALGIAVPQTHQAFLELLSSFDLTTEGGRTLYASVSQLAPLFVQVAGTADQAAQALAEQIKSAQDFFNQNFFSDAEKQAQQFAAAMDQVAAAESALGISIPTTINGFRELVLGIDRSTDAGEALYDALIVLAPAIFDLGKAADTAADQISSAAAQIITSVGGLIQGANQLADDMLQKIENLASASPGDFGEKLSIQLQLIQSAISNADRADFTSNTAFTTYVGRLRSTADALTTELARFTVLSAQYDAGRAEQLVELEQWYNEQLSIFGFDKIQTQVAALERFRDSMLRFGLALTDPRILAIDDQIATIEASGGAALDALKTIYDQKWNAIVNGATEAAASLDDFIQKIQQLADSTRGNVGQQARLEMALTLAKINDLTIAYRALSNPASAQAAALFTQITQLRTYNDGLARQIAHFTTYSAQYGVAVANQLVELENQFETWKLAVGDNADALAILQEIFDDQWQAIIDSLKGGVDGSLAELARLKQGIADYLKGLVVSDISPLSPAEKLAQAATAFNAELALAQTGDVKALGDITQFADTYLNLAREFYKSSQPFVDIFNAITQSLGNLAGTLPTGQPLPASQEEVNAAIASALPDGKIASQADITANTEATQSLEATVKEYLAALATSNTADALSLKQALEQQQQASSDAAASTAK